MTIKSQKKCGYVALVGRPNAGKSSLLNRFVGEKISIITHKAQTTRSCIRAFAIYQETQIIFIDTPGLFTAKKTIDKSMFSAAIKAINDADIVLYVKDSCTIFDESETEILEQCIKHSNKLCLILNKIDKLSREKLLPLCNEITQSYNFDKVFMVSAKTNNGISDIFPYINNNLPQMNWLYPEEEIAEMPQRFFLAEITREKLILNLHDEIPYALTVETDKCKKLKNKRMRIEQTIYVERQSQKKIVIGHKGALLKHIGSLARVEMQDFLRCDVVDLFLFVKISPDWQNKIQHYKAMALDMV